MRPVPGVFRSGPQVLDDGSTRVIRAGKTAESVIGRQLHGDYLEQATRGKVFSTPFQFSPFLQVAPGPSNCACIYNPANSNTFVSLIRWEIVVTTAPTLPSIAGWFLMANTNPSGGAPTIGNVDATIPAILSSQVVSVAKVFRGSVNLPAAATFYRPFVNHLTGDGTQLPNMSGFFIDFQGTCVIAPGCIISLAQDPTDAGVFARVNVNIIWEELGI
jgi:hypothetical protein